MPIRNTSPGIIWPGLPSACSTWLQSTGAGCVAGTCPRAAGALITTSARATIAARPARARAVLRLGTFMKYLPLRPVRTDSVSEHKEIDNHRDQPGDPGGTD